jgi:polyisoprenoid-binding protein YceI
VARYRIVPERSHVYIDAKSSLHPIHSTTDGLEGLVEFEFGSDGEVDLSNKPVGKLSLAVTKLSSGNRMEDRELHKRIDSRRFPTIEGVLDQMEPAGKEAYQVTGEITFRGVTKTHQDQMTIHVADEQTIELEGKSRFDIREFGMEPPKMLMLKVDPEVDVRVDIIAVKEG